MTRGESNGFGQQYFGLLSKGRCVLKAKSTLRDLKKRQGSLQERSTIQPHAIRVDQALRSHQHRRFKWGLRNISRQGSRLTSIQIPTSNDRDYCPHVQFEHYFHREASAECRKGRKMVSLANKCRKARLRGWRTPTARRLRSSHQIHCTHTLQSVHPHLSFSDILFGLDWLQSAEEGERVQEDWRRG